MSNSYTFADQAAIDGERIIAVSYLEADHDGDSGVMFFAGEPDERDVGGAVHLDCVTDNDLTLLEAMAIAREHGVAVRQGGNWVPCE
jgi:hypothetical protein